MNILIVDDEVAFRQITKSYFGKEHIIFEAGNGKDALSLVIECYKNPNMQIDLIVMDKNMPNIDGFQVVKAIRKYEKANRILEKDRSKIVMLTAESCHDVRAEAFKLEVDTFITKPIVYERAKLKLQRIGVDIVKPESVTV